MNFGIEKSVPCVLHCNHCDCGIFFGFSQSSAAQTAVDAPAPGSTPAASSQNEGHEIYISWGYNTESYRPVELHMAQPTLGNDFTMHAVDYHDSKGWSTGLLSHTVTGPQYNFQIGYYFRKNTAFDVNFAHAKAIVTQDQTVRMTGTLAGQPVDKNVVLTEDVLIYKLNNGANFALFNAVQRFRILRQPGQTGSIAVLGKAGIGFVVPHTENTLFGIPNEEGFQFSGPDLGIELAVRLHVFRAIIPSSARKASTLVIVASTSTRAMRNTELWAHVTSLSFGASFHIGKKNKRHSFYTSSYLTLWQFRCTPGCLQISSFGECMT